jgi:molybdenum cofactor biosynthesis protein B
MNDELNEGERITHTPEPDDQSKNGQDHGTQKAEHSHHDHDVVSVGVAVVTVSSSRSLDNDPAGDAIAAAFDAEGHTTVTREMLRDSYDRIQTAVESLAKRSDVDCVVTSGGTGVTPDDVTVEAVDDLFDKRLPGFGELFRTLSYDEMGTRVVGTRAVAGVMDGTMVFCLPGSENAARLGAVEIIVPEVTHLCGLATRSEDGDHAE